MKSCAERINAAQRHWQPKATPKAGSARGAVYKQRCQAVRRFFGGAKRSAAGVGVADPPEGAAIGTEGRDRRAREAQRLKARSAKPSPPAYLFIATPHKRTREIMENAHYFRLPQ